MLQELETKKPTIIESKNNYRFGAPIEGTIKSMGPPLGQKVIEAAKKRLTDGKERSLFQKK